MRLHLKSFKTSKGFSLVEVLVSTAMMSILGLGAVSISSLSNQSSLQLKTVRIVISARAQIEAAMKSPAAWRETTNRNANFNCMTTTPGCSLSPTPDGFYNFVLYDSQGAQKLTYDATDPTSRISGQGGQCPVGTADPSLDCPFKFQAQWRPNCQTYPCLAPTIEIQINLIADFPSSLKVPLNLSNYSYSSVRGINEDTIQSACVILNGIYNSINHTCRPKHAGKTCAANGLPYQVVTGLEDNGNIECSPLYRGQCSSSQIMTGVDSSGQAVCVSKIGICPATNCQGNWGACTAACGGGTRTYTVTAPATYGGAACAASNGTVQACNTQACVVPVNCVGSWGACSKTCGSGTQTFTVTTPAANGGTSCSYANGATQTCNTQACPQNCVGAWGSCSRTCGGGTKTFSISVPAANGGTSCSYANGASQSCNTQACPVNCSGSWSSCSQACGGGIKTFTVTQAAANGGSGCAYSTGDTSPCNQQACTPTPVNCSGSWGSCNPGTGTQDYLVTQFPSNGGTSCPSSPRSCAVSCVGSWGACNGSGIKTYSVTQWPLNGGSACTYSDGQTSTSGCVAPTTTTTTTVTTTTRPSVTTTTVKVAHEYCYYGALDGGLYDKLSGPDGCETPNGYNNCFRGIYPEGSCGGFPAP